MADEPRHVNVTKMDLCERTSDEWVFRVTGVSTSDRMLATRVFYSGCPTDAKVVDIGSVAEAILVKAAQPDFQKIHDAGQRCMLVVDLTLFPRVLLRIDDRDPRAQAALSTEQGFYRDLVAKWQGYDVKTEIPAVLMNQNEHCIVIKTLNANSDVDR
jgi:hypothetical protein